MTPQDHALAQLIALARPYAHGALAGHELLAALARVITTRSAPGDPPPPLVNGLQVRREGLPDWWTHGDNLMLAASSSTFSLGNGYGAHLVTGNVGVVGEKVQGGSLTFPDTGGFVVIGDRGRLANVAIAASRNGSVLVGEDTTAASYARVDARNGGAVIVGADGMWSNSVNLVSDDMHAIRDLETGQRVNGFGGRIVVERHVWLCEQARILGGTRIGNDTVVGLGSTASKTTLPANSVCVGAPCKPIRWATTWTREDLP